MAKKKVNNPIIMILIIIGIMFVLQQPTFTGSVADGCKSDVMIVVDTSGSMAAVEGYRTRVQNVAYAAWPFIDGLDYATDQVGAVSYSAQAELESPLTTNPTMVKNRLLGLEGVGQANLGDAILLADSQYSASLDRDKIMIVIADGGPNAMSKDGQIEYCFIAPSSPTNCTIYAEDMAAQAKTNGDTIYTIGIAVNDFTAGMLRNIATSSSTAFLVDDSTMLDPVFTSISDGLCTQYVPSCDDKKLSMIDSITGWLANLISRDQLGVKIDEWANCQQ